MEKHVRAWPLLKVYRPRLFMHNCTGRKQAGNKGDWVCSSHSQIPRINRRLMRHTGTDNRGRALHLNGRPGRDDANPCDWHIITTHNSDWRWTLIPRVKETSGQRWATKTLPISHLTCCLPKDQSTIDQFINVNLKYTYFHRHAKKTNIKHLRLIIFQSMFAIYFNTTRSDNLIKLGQWKPNNTHFIHCLGFSFDFKLSDTIYSKGEGEHFI